MCVRTLRVASLILMILVANNARADQWLRFRGPNGSGVTEAANLPERFGPELNVVWKVPLPPGHSSPVVTDNHVFLTAVEKDELFTLCLDRRTGAMLWRRAAPRSRQEKLDPRNNPASPTPATDGRRVCVFFPDYGLLYYDLSGKELWRKPLGPFNNLYGMGASPILVKDKVLLVCDQNRDSFILALHAATGEKAWRTERPEAKSGHSTPIVYESPDGSVQALAPGSFLLTSYFVDSGRKAWWAGGLSFEMKSTPVIGKGNVYVNGYGSPANQPGSLVEVPPFEEVLPKQDGDKNGRLAREEMPTARGRGFFPAFDLDGSGELDVDEWNYYRAAMASTNSMMAIRLGGKGDVTDQNVVWKHHRSIPQLPSPLLYKGLLYMINDTGIATCFDPVSGEVRSRGRLKGATGNYYASPVAADGKIFFVSEAGKLAVVKPDGSLEVTAASELGESCYATPAIAHDRIYLRTVGHLYCFGK